MTTTHVYNFRKRFAAAVERGDKRQTIRAHRKDGRRPQVGDRVHCYTGLRSADSRILAKGRCVGVTPIRIDVAAREIVVGDTALTTVREQLAFARRDGFDTRDDLFAFFYLAYGRTFDGLVIAWEPLP